MRSDYGVREVAAGVWLVDEFGLAGCYLVVGEERALLVDCLTGVGDLRGVVESITTLPFDVVGTHAHPDHIGGCGQFEKVFLHPNDICFLHRVMCSKVGRKVICLGSEGKLRKKDLTKPKFKTEWVALKEGQVFDLGGRTVSVHLAKGHTTGSVVLVDETANCVFAGDNLNVEQWLFLPRSTSVEGWLKTAEWLKELSEGKRVFVGHLPYEQDPSIFDKQMANARAIMAAQKRNKKWFKIATYPNKKRDGGEMIIYRKGNVFEKGAR